MGLTADVSTSRSTETTTPCVIDNASVHPKDTAHDAAPAGSSRSQTSTKVPAASLTQLRLSSPAQEAGTDVVSNEIAAFLAGDNQFSSDSE